MQLPPDYSQWTTIIAQKFTSQFPEAAKAVANVAIEDLDQEAGTGHGIITLGQTQAAVPFVIHEGDLKDFETVVTSNGNFYPATRENLQKVLFAPEAFGNAVNVVEHERSVKNRDDTVDITRMTGMKGNYGSQLLGAGTDSTYSHLLKYSSIEENKKDRYLRQNPNHHWKVSEVTSLLDGVTKEAAAPIIPKTLLLQLDGDQFMVKDANFKGGDATPVPPHTANRLLDALGPDETATVMGGDAVLLDFVKDRTGQLLYDRDKFLGTMEPLNTVCRALTVQSPQLDAVEGLHFPASALYTIPDRGLFIRTSAYTDSVGNSDELAHAHAVQAACYGFNMDSNIEEILESHSVPVDRIGYEGEYCFVGKDSEGAWSVFGPVYFCGCTERHDVKERFELPPENSDKAQIPSAKRPIDTGGVRYYTAAMRYGISAGNNCQITFSNKVTTINKVEVGGVETYIIPIRYRAISVGDHIRILDRPSSFSDLSAGNIKVASVTCDRGAYAVNGRFVGDENAVTLDMFDQYDLPHSMAGSILKKAKEQGHIEVGILVPSQIDKSAAVEEEREVPLTFDEELLDSTFSCWDELSDFVKQAVLSSSGIFETEFGVDDIAEILPAIDDARNALGKMLVHSQANKVPASENELRTIFHKLDDLYMRFKSFSHPVAS